MLIPFRRDGQRNIFLLNNVEDYGLPEENGYSSEYEVIDDEPEYVSTFKNDSNYELPIKTPHRYERVSRFRTILGQLQGIVGFVSKKSQIDLEDILFQLPKDIEIYPPCLVWKTISKVLKDNKYTRYKNRIPAILASIGLLKVQMITRKNMLRIMADFRKMEKAFDFVKKTFNRKYFPSLRYTALKLMEKHGEKVNIYIPLALHEGCLKKLNDDYEYIWSWLEEEEDLQIEKEIINFLNIYSACFVETNVPCST